MKIRNGFVSNSSSSSFICDVCGGSDEGWDLAFEDSHMFECEFHHIVCKSHALKIFLPCQKNF